MEEENKLSSEWIIAVKKYFLDFLEETGFDPSLSRGSRGPDEKYPEWLIMLIAVLCVKCQVKTYVGIHRMTEKYWKLLASKKSLTIISERQLRDRLKKIGHTFGKPPTFIFQIFPAEFFKETSRKRRQDDDKKQGSRVAQKTKRTESHARKTERRR